MTCNMKTLMTASADSLVDIVNQTSRHNPLFYCFYRPNKYFLHLLCWATVSILGAANAVTMVVDVRGDSSAARIGLPVFSSTGVPGGMTSMSASMVDQRHVADRTRSNCRLLLDVEFTPNRPCGVRVGCSLPVVDTVTSFCTTTALDQADAASGTNSCTASASSDAVMHCANGVGDATGIADLTRQTVNGTHAGQQVAKTLHAEHLKKRRRQERAPCFEAGNMMNYLEMKRWKQQSQPERPSLHLTVKPMTVLQRRLQTQASLKKMWDEHRQRTRNCVPKVTWKTRALVHEHQ